MIWKPTGGVGSGLRASERSNGAQRGNQAKWDAVAQKQVAAREGSLLFPRSIREFTRSTELPDWDILHGVSTVRVLSKISLERAASASKYLDSINSRSVLFETVLCMMPVQFRLFWN
ncbi:hypothetical protein R1flu_017174 [Riccia fluitans]|uniref:Uncharacterized protein n=1 Tax=Riccia fluitans TaxID=41844 RepID=A0ABD1XHD7_9MARC